jgi:hypothetical protein
MSGGFDGSRDNLGYPQGDEADAASRIQYEKELVRRRKAAGVAEGASEAVIEQAEAEQREALDRQEMEEHYAKRASDDLEPSDNRWWWQKLAGTGKASGGLGVKKTIGKKGGGRRTRGRRTRGRVPRKTKPHRTKRASSNRGSDWRSHIKRTMKNNPNMKFGKDLLKLASRTFKKGVKPIYS